MAEFCILGHLQDKKIISFELRPPYKSAEKIIKHSKFNIKFVIRRPVEMAWSTNKTNSVPYLATIYKIWIEWSLFFCHLFSGSKAVTEMYQRRDFSLNDTWEALFDRRLGQKVEVMVRIPSNAPVGKEMFRAMFGLLAVLIYLVRR